MYEINDLNKLYKDIKNFIKGESLIQSDYLFKINYNNLNKDCFFKVKDNLEILIGEDNLYIDFNDLEKNTIEESTCLIFDFILNCLNIREQISDIILEESYSKKNISLSYDHHLLSLLYFEIDKNISERTNNPFYIIKKEKVLLNIKSISLNEFDKEFYLCIDESNTSYSMKVIEYKDVIRIKDFIDKKMFL